MSPAFRRGFLSSWLHLLSHVCVTAVTDARGLALTTQAGLLKLPAGGCMKDIHEVLRQKQAKYAQLGKQIEMLQQAAEKLREVAPLLAESDDEDATILTDMDDPIPTIAKATAAHAPAPSPPSAPKHLSRLAP